MNLVPPFLFGASARRVDKDPVLLWLRSMPGLYEKLKEQAEHPVSSFYTTGFAPTAEGERETLVCISTAGIASGPDDGLGFKEETE